MAALDHRGHPQDPHAEAAAVARTHQPHGQTPAPQGRRGRLRRERPARRQRWHFGQSGEKGGGVVRAARGGRPLQPTRRRLGGLGPDQGIVSRAQGNRRESVEGDREPPERDQQRQRGGRRRFNVGAEGGAEAGAVQGAGGAGGPFVQGARVQEPGRDAQETEGVVARKGTAKGRPLSFGGLGTRLVDIRSYIILHSYLLISILSVE